MNKYYAIAIGCILVCLLSFGIFQSGYNRGYKDGASVRIVSVTTLYCDDFFWRLTHLEEAESCEMFEEKELIE